jgi:hypothetical protein
VKPTDESRAKQAIRRANVATKQITNHQPSAPWRPN